MNDWIFENETVTELPEECTGFVYLITNTITGRKYIGKKLARFKTTKPPLKGKKNKRRGHKESDWKDYFLDEATLGTSVFGKGAQQESKRAQGVRLCPKPSFRFPGNL